MGEPNLADLAEFISRHLVQDPERVVVEEESGEGGSVLKIRASSQDVGRLIGRRGRTVGAIRAVVETVAARADRRVSVEVVDPDASPGRR